MQQICLSAIFNSITNEKNKMMKILAGQANKVRLHVLHTGEVRVSPYLPFGGDNCNLLKASGMTTPKEDWIWLPVSVYLIFRPFR